MEVHDIIIISNRLQKRKLIFLKIKSFKESIIIDIR